MSELITKTEAFLRETFKSSPRADKLAYRLEHSYRVANIGKTIAEAESFDVEGMVVSCLLHDISYCEEMLSAEQQRSHGRRSAEIARAFLEGLNLPRERMNDILFGIAIHVDDAAGFEWRRTAFAESISDADNIDRFDAYRIYESLEYEGFSKLSLEDKRIRTERILSRLAQLRDMPMATGTARALWRERIDFNVEFYKRLQRQLLVSSKIL